MNDETTEIGAAPAVDTTPEPEIAAVEVPAVNIEAAKPSDPSFGKITHPVSEYETAKPERRAEDPDEVQSRISPYQVKK